MSRDDNLREELDRTIQEFSHYDSNPSTWLSWMLYLLKGLEGQSVGINPMGRELYNDTLNYLQDAIRNRLRTGGW